MNLSTGQINDILRKHFDEGTTIESLEFNPEETIEKNTKKLCSFQEVGDFITQYLGHKKPLTFHHILNTIEKLKDNEGVIIGEKDLNRSGERHVSVFRIATKHDFPIYIIKALSYIPHPPREHLRL